MRVKNNRIGILFLMLFYVFHINASAQTKVESPKTKKTESIRGLNAVDFGAGTAVINGDLMDPKYEVYFHVGYKRYLLPYLNVNFSYNKFNLAYKDIYNEGFMSFDLNVESTLLPKQKFSPFIFGGAGYNASNYFKQTAIKFQGGGGFEYLIMEELGLKLYADYNYVQSDELDGLIAGASDDTYIRIGFGVNYYFGGGKKKSKIEDNEPSVIKTNQINFR